MKQHIKTSLQSLMIAILVVNAVGPAPVAARSLQQSAPVQPFTSNPVSQNVPTEQVSPTPDTASTPGEIPTPALEEEQLTLTPTPATETSAATASPTAVQAAVGTLTPTPVGPAPLLVFNLSASPQQAAPGDQVTFTVQIKNNDTKPVTGLVFSTTLPEEFGTGKSGLKDFTFDPQSRLLTWDGAEKPQAPSQGAPVTDDQVLLPGESLTLHYTLRVDAKVDEIQITDTATLLADGLARPLEAAATLTVLSDDKDLNKVGAQGGQALGLDGKVRVKFPAGALAGTRQLLVKDLKEKSAGGKQSPGLVFELEMLENQAAAVESLNEVQADSILPLEAAEDTFDKPVDITVSFDGMTDLDTLPADQAPYLVTLDEASGTWVRVPLKSVDRQANTITAETTHFSTWGAGIGPAFPQNGANILLFDSAYPSLFTGRSQFSIPIWTPEGRNGMAPSLALSYSSGTVEGVLGDVQAPWVGMGWSVDTVEIARKITSGVCTPCGGGSYGYGNQFVLLFNGTGYELLPDGATPGRYHTEEESFFYIQLHNDDLGNNSPAAQNATGEWWEVVEPDGTRWRLGWNADSEQLAAMAGYPGAASGAWSGLGYAGHATDVVASRWRVDLVTDTYGNNMTSTYTEETRQVAGTTTDYDRASYPDMIAYTGHTSMTPAAGYSVIFVPEGRSGSDVPVPQNHWDNWDTSRLDRIEVRYGTSVVRTYDLGYNVRSYSDDGTSWETTTLTSVAVSGGATNAPTTTFTYADYDNRANCGTGCQEWANPRLSTIANGWGATTTYTYTNDARPSTSWYNWQVQALAVADGISPGPMTRSYSYSGACYDDPTAGWCNASSEGELTGFAETTVITKDFNTTTTLAIALHKFYTDAQKAGQEYELQNQDASGTILSQTNTTHTTVTSGLPSGGYFTYASAVDEYLRSDSSLNLISHTENEYDTATGNLTSEKEYDGTPALYRETDYEYVTNASPSVWILDKVSRKLLKDAVGTVVSEEQYGYDDNLPNAGSLTHGALTLTRQLSGSQTVDTAYIYDVYGNQRESHAYTSYGTNGSAPGGSYRTSSITTYDTALKTYVVSATNALTHVTYTDYDYGLGLPTLVTDPNNNTTTTTYDGLGRVLSVTHPGYSQANILYTYPSLPLSAPFALKMDVWDESSGVYRSLWEILDGLGRTLQTQSPDQNAGSLVLTDTSYNALSLVQNGGLPRTLSGTGGSYSAPTWSGIPHTITSYDALSRKTNVAYPDGSEEATFYFGLLTTSVDRNSHLKIQGNDPFGRLVSVQEYTGSGPYDLYATTTYIYDQRDLLIQTTDAAGNQTTINYNGFGRKSSMVDPDLGTWSYIYDVFGNLTSQTDARTCVVTVAYDVLNRPTGKTYTGSGACATTPSVTYSYDSTTGGNEGIGQRTGMTDGSGSSAWVYNVLGQVVTETHTVDGTTYTTSTTNDSFDRMLTKTLPSSEVLTYSYNAMGALSGLSGTNTYLSNVHYNAGGQVTDQLLGNGILQQFCYETNTQRLAAMRAYSGSLQSCGTNPSSPRLNLSYIYQPNGNISQVVDATRNETLNYIYDELDRLLTVYGPYTQRYAYNSIGNITTRTVPIQTSIDTNTHVCALTDAGGVKCWGGNTEGQLGDGTQTDRSMPVDVVGLSSGVITIATGGWYTCAITNTGGAKCWGSNTYGQLGDGTTTRRKTPVNVSGLTSGVTAITTGTSHTCALTNVGGVKCWGSNNTGQLGDGTTTQRLTAVDVSGLTSGVVAISAGANYTCAVTNIGGVKCWGQNSYGGLGDGTTTQRLTPVDVSGLTNGVTSVTAGNYYTCALTSIGGVKCWGQNTYGQLGDGTTTQRLTPVDVSGLVTGVTIIGAGPATGCALTNTGGVKCWGYNANGQVGDGTTTNRLMPVDVSGLTSGVTAIGVGPAICALTNANVLKCWGSSYLLGDGTFGYFTSPINVSGLSSGVATINTRNAHTCVLTSAGGVKCWGDNFYGQLGDGTWTERLEAVDVSGLTSGVVKISVGSKHTCALTSAGGVKCWGENTYGQLGDGTTFHRMIPGNVTGLSSGVIAIAAGPLNTCALTNTGGVKCWGYNANGQVGDGTTIQRLTPVNVSGLTSGVTTIAVGGGQACARTSAGGLKCWGLNTYGQVGDGTTTNCLTPVDVSGLTSGVATVATGVWYTCAITNTGGAKCWGHNSYGQLGDGTTTNRLTPVDVSGLSSGVAIIAPGGTGNGLHTCVVTNAGGAKCWGDNSKGQLGDGTLVQRITPVDVNGLSSGVTIIAAGGSYTCVRTSAGGAKCWGQNISALGIGAAGFATTPVSSLFVNAPVTYTYGNFAHKHAVTSLSTGETYTYDANGNMTQRVEGGLTYTQVFDAENRLVSVTVSGQTTQFVYDGDGNLVKKIKPDNSRTIYIGSVYEVNKNAGGTVTGSTTYYPDAGAMRVDGTLYYTLKDHLDSASVTLNASGTTVGEQRYYPFGETRVATGSMFTDHLYTGQRQMVSLGLYHYGARFYSPKLGRFISPDTIIPDESNPQSWNRYSYVENNPLSFNDPTGHKKAPVAKNKKNKSGKKDGIPGVPDDWVRTLEKGVQFIARDVPNFAKPLFVRGGAIGTRLLTFDHPHSGANYYHLNSDLKALQALNHKNIEPLLRDVATKVAVARVVISAAAAAAKAYGSAIAAAAKDFGSAAGSFMMSRPTLIFPIPSNWREYMPNPSYQT